MPAALRPRCAAADRASPSGRPGARCARSCTTVAGLPAGVVRPGRPERHQRLTPVAFLRLPLEGLLLVALVLVLPPGASGHSGGAWSAWFSALLTLVKFFDMGFFEALRPAVQPGDGLVLRRCPPFGLLSDSIGRTGAIVGRRWWPSLPLAAMLVVHAAGAAPADPARGRAPQHVDHDPSRRSGRSGCCSPCSGVQIVHGRAVRLDERGRPDLRPGAAGTGRHSAIRRCSPRPSPTTRSRQPDASWPTAAPPTTTRKRQRSRRGGISARGGTAARRHRRRPALAPAPAAPAAPATATVADTSPGSELAHGPARQGRHHRLRRELRTGRGPGFVVVARQIDATLDAGTGQLGQAGFAAKSGFLTSPTFGGAAAGWPIRRCNPACGSTTNSATTSWSPATG